MAACAAKEGIAGIFSEKPVAVGLAEADRAVEACRGDAQVDWVVAAVDGDPADAHLGRIDEHSDHDQGVAFGVIGFANGLTAHLHRNVSAKNGIEVLGSDGVLFIGQSRVGEIWRRDGRDLKLARSLFPHPDPGQAALHQYDEEGCWRSRARA